MRSTVGVAAALLLGCAQSEKQPDAVAAVAAAPPTAAASNCTAMMPMVSIAPYADIALCGANGSTPTQAFADAHGDVALGCGTSFALFLAMPYGFVSKAPLGSAAWPVADGFVGAVSGGPFQLFQRDGMVSAQMTGAQALPGPRGVLVASVDSSGISVQAFGDAPQFVGEAPAGVSIAGAGDTNGHTLVLWQTHARWLPGGAVFEVEPGMQAAALADGSIALRKDGAWIGVTRFPAQTVDAAPAWLAGRGDFFLARGGQAMAFGDELLAADGTSCGPMKLGAPLIGVGLDGTAITAKDSTTFRIYPQLLH